MKEVKQLTAMDGKVTVRLENKRTGKIEKEETHQNAITDGFLRYMLANAISSATLHPLLRGGVKNVAPLSQINMLHPPLHGTANGLWGIYALKEARDITKRTHIPPYLNGVNAIDEELVTFWNANPATVENMKEMQLVDFRSGYSRINGENKHTVEYLKNTHIGTVRSVVLGRAHTSPLSFVGQTIGELTHQANWITGRAATAVEHRSDRTLLWKASATTPVIIDLNSKEIHLTGVGRTPISNANLLLLLNLATTTGAGCVVMNGGFFRGDIGTVGTGFVNVRLSRFITDAVAQVRDVRIDFPAGMTYTDTCFPITVARPDLGDVVEVFLITANGIPTAGGASGAKVTKVIFSNIFSVDLPNIQAEIVDCGVMTGPVPSARALFEGLGFYDTEKSQYWLPCMMSADRITGNVVANGNAETVPGYIFNAGPTIGTGENRQQQLTRVYEEDWSARAAGAGNPGGAICPVIDNNGLNSILYDVATPYYPKISQVLSGVVLSEDYVKTDENILRIIYSYTLA